MTGCDSKVEQCNAFIDEANDSQNAYVALEVAIQSPASIKQRTDQLDSSSKKMKELKLADPKLKDFRDRYVTQTDDFSAGMPCSTYQAWRVATQYSNHSAESAGGTKYSSSICSNSRVRKTKLPGVISLRKLLPTWAIPNGGFFRVVWRTFLKLMNMPCAVSGRR